MNFQILQGVIMSEREQRRRDFLKVGALSAASAPLLIQGKAFAIPISSKDVKWEKTVDIAIIGSGFSGLAAGIEAKKNKANEVYIFEKMTVFGGNSAINGGLFAAPNTPLQEQENIVDSPEKMVQDQLISGRGIAHEDLLKHIASHAREALQLTIDAGALYHPYLQQLGGHSVPRTYQTSVSCGAGITQPLVKECKRLGVHLVNRAKMEGFILNDDGSIAGIKIREKYHFGDEASGTLINVKAKRGVIVATGGFSQNILLRSAQDPTLTSDVGCTNVEGATGEGLLYMLQLGAIPVHLTHIQSGPWASPDEGGFGYVSNYAIYNFPHSVAIDTRTGKRFMNEIADRKTRSDAELLCKDDKGNPVPPIMITSFKYANEYPGCAKVLKYKVGWKFDSIEDIAKQFSIPLNELKAQIDEYNRYAQSGVDKQFNKSMALGKDKPVEAPYVVVRLWPKVHYCQGGVLVNTRAQVLDSMTGKPIKNLFAAGEVTGGIHGVSRLGSCSIPECLVMGMTAARSALA